MELEEMIELAELHIDKCTHPRYHASVLVAIEDAKLLLAKGKLAAAGARAAASLGFSVGTNHPDYRRVKEAADSLFGPQRPKAKYVCVKCKTDCDGMDQCPKCGGFEKRRIEPKPS